MGNVLPEYHRDSVHYKTNMIKYKLNGVNSKLFIKKAVKTISNVENKQLWIFVNVGNYGWI